MRTDFFRYIFFTSVLLFIVWTISCSGRTGAGTAVPSPEVNKSAPAEEAPSFVTMVSPAENAEFRTGDRIDLVLESRGSNRVPDSVVVFFDGKKISVLGTEPWELTIPATMTPATGRKPVKVTAYRDGRSQTLTRVVVLLSDKVPEKKAYSVVKSYPHDREAFTQGLFFDEGLFYEGTGQESGSSLREVEPETGKVIRQLNLDPSLFGEGITLYGDRIYQVTWTSKVGFVYRKSDFGLINRIYYQTQGWGLTTVDKTIVMSDGSNVLSFYEPEGFTVVRRLEVYDNEKMVDQLNELEYINGEIWANVWMTDLIARIDPVTGKVNSYIDLAGLFPEQARRETNADVLNGIAWDRQNGRVFVTGKRWPNLYEIKVAN